MKHPCSEYAFKLVHWLATETFGDQLREVRYDTEAEDKHEIGDVVIDLVDGKRLHVGVRERNGDHRDCTIRVVNEGNTTEWKKIAAGKGSWLVFTWENKEGQRDYALIELEIARQKGMFAGDPSAKPWNLLPPDATTQATSTNIFQLYDANCVIACRVTEQRPSEIADILTELHGPPRQIVRNPYPKV